VKEFLKEKKKTYEKYILSLISKLPFCPFLKDQYLTMKETFSAKLTDYLNEETIGSFGKKKKNSFVNHFLSVSGLFYPCLGSSEVEFTD